MPHNFDYEAHQERLQAGDNGNFNQLDAVTVGPDADEIWDLKDVYLSVRATAISHSASPARFAMSSGLHTGASDFLLPSGDLETGSAGTASGRSSRYLWADASSGGYAGIEDDTNGEGSSPVNIVFDEHLRFDLGDLRISFPGSLDLQVSVDNTKGGGVSAVNVEASLAAQYIPEPRHG